MGRGEKLLNRMRANPRDWRIEDVQALCKAFDIDIDRPSGGSHYGVSAPGSSQHVTVPFARPIKAVYIRKLVRFVDAVLAGREDR
ncbi:MAG TPA: type II toxin-antitoxin system HicA family toxin [Allosphingosinicella sp.]|nr:type II toxin-antitoxin system HicA family toxin [Allosphingosinicella sp.]